jgi:hypothetical protein
MKKAVIVSASTLALACGAVVPTALGSGGTHAAGPTVTVTVKTQTRTLLNSTRVRGERHSITKGGIPRGKCPGDTAAGALDRATHGKWNATYYPSVGGLFVTSIEGVKPTGSYYWGFFVNGKTSNLGICELKLRQGQKLLFKIIK